MPPLKNLKREKFCREYMTGKKQSHAYMAAYPNSTKPAAIKNSSRMKTYEDIRHRCLEIMEATTGLRLEDFLLSLKELTLSQYPLVIRDTIKMYSDNGVRLEAIKTGFKLLGLLSPANLQTVEDNRSITFNLNVNDINRLQDIVKSMQDMRLQTNVISGRIKSDTS